MSCVCMYAHIFPAKKQSFHFKWLIKLKVKSKALYICAYIHINLKVKTIHPYTSVCECIYTHIFLVVELEFEFSNLNLLSRHSTFCFGNFWERVSHLCPGMSGTCSSYLYFPRSWNDRHISSCPAYWLRWGLMNFWAQFASNHDPPDLCSKGSRATGMSHWGKLHNSVL
jgi:hypothetical protein